MRSDEFQHSDLPLWHPLNHFHFFSSAGPTRGPDGSESLVRYSLLTPFSSSSPDPSSSFGPLNPKVFSHEVPPHRLNPYGVCVTSVDKRRVEVDKGRK